MILMANENNYALRRTQECSALAQFTDLNCRLTILADQPHSILRHCFDAEGVGVISDDERAGAEFRARYSRSNSPF